MTRGAIAAVFVVLQWNPLVEKWPFNPFETWDAYVVVDPSSREIDSEAPEWSPEDSRSPWGGAAKPNDGTHALLLPNYGWMSYEHLGAWGQARDQTLSEKLATIVRDA